MLAREAVHTAYVLPVLLLLVPEALHELLKMWAHPMNLQPKHFLCDRV